MSAAVSTVLSFMDGFETGSDAPAAEFLHDEIEVHDFDLPDAGVYHGLEGAARWLADWDAPWDEWSGKVHDFLDLGPQVATLSHLRARTASGLSVDREDSQLFTMRDGKIAKLEYFSEAGTALERADDPPRAAGRGDVHGKIREIYGAALREDVAFEAWEFVRFDVERLIDAGDSVVALFEMLNRGRGSGIELTGRWGEVWETDGMDLIRSRFYQSHDEALGAAGLA